jgi:thiamine biosynthesis lipoprotein
MSTMGPSGRLTQLPAAGASSPFGRRRFLVSFGLLAGASLLAPALIRSHRRGAERVEAARPLLGTWVRIVVRHGDGALAEHALERAFAAIREVDASMSIHRADSELARVNAAAGVSAVAVGDDLLAVFERAREVARRSGGVYDPTVLPLMRLWGFYGSTRGRWPDDHEIAVALHRTGCTLAVADRAAGTLGLTRRGAALDLGSIGKGWAVDRAVASLRASGIESALVDVGRNVYGLGVPEDGAGGWSVGVLHPVTGAVDRVFTLRDRAVATSGNAEQGHEIGGRRVGHLLDARLGRPADGPLSATVVADNGTDADAGSTLAYLVGPSRTDLLPAHAAAHFIG